MFLLTLIKRQSLKLFNGNSEITVTETIMGHHFSAFWLKSGVELQANSLKKHDVTGILTKSKLF